MIKVENVQTFGWEAAIRGMRNAKNSWAKSDSVMIDGEFHVGENDLRLMRQLFSAGSEHRKYLRMLHIQMDIITNHTVWQEFDTYKVGTVRNSCSKMHKIHVAPFTIDSFSHEGVDEVGEHTLEVYSIYLAELERLRLLYNETKDQKYWRAIIDMLPMGFNMRATVDFSYETAINMIRQRAGHKMFEWRGFVAILKSLPLMKELIDK